MTEPTTTAVVPVADFQEYENAEIPYAARASELIQSAERAVANNAETMQKCSELDGMLAACSKKIEDERKSWVQPLNGQVTRINGQFKMMSVPLDKARQHVKSLMLAHHRSEQDRLAREAEEQRKREEDERLRVAAEQEAEALKLRQSAEAAKESGDAVQAEAMQQAADNKQALADMAVDDAINTPPPAPIATGPVRGDTGSVTGIQELWDFEVTDLDDVPRKWLIPDEKMIKAAIKGKYGLREIKGIRIFDKGKVTTR